IKAPNDPGQERKRKDGRGVLRMGGIKTAINKCQSGYKADPRRSSELTCNCEHSHATEQPDEEPICSEATLCASEYRARNNRDRRLISQLRLGIVRRTGTLPRIPKHDAAGTRVVSDQGESGRKETLSIPYRRLPATNEWEVPDGKHQRQKQSCHGPVPGCTAGLSFTLVCYQVFAYSCGIDKHVHRQMTISGEANCESRNIGTILRAGYR